MEYIKVFLTFIFLIIIKCDLIEIPMSKTLKKPSYFNKQLNLINGNQLIKDASLLELSGIRDGLYTIKINIGNPPQIFDVIVDTGSYMLWIPSQDCSCSYSKKFNYKASITVQKSNKPMSLRYISGSVSGMIADDQLLLSEGLKLNKFNFLLSDVVNTPISVDGIMGFSKLYTNYGNDYSIMHNLYSNGVIKNKMFSQRVVMGQGKFYIGDLADEIKQDMNNFTTCKSNNDSYSVRNFWTCNLKNVYIGNSVNDKQLISDHTVPAIFDTGSNVIIAPYSLFEKFKTFYFKEALEKNECYIIEDFNGSNAIRCRGIIELPTIYLKFDNGFIYSINSKQLFSEEYDEMFKIVFASSPGGGWLLGQPFLIQYHIVFNHEDNTVGFYNNLNGFSKDLSFIHIDKNESNLILLLIILSILLILTLFIWLGRKNKIKYEPLIKNYSKTYYI